MRRDSIFYTLFQKYPNILFALLENPPANAANYRFDSVAVKEPRFEIDGVFLPAEASPPGTIYFCELQIQKDDELYELLFAESMLYFYRQRKRFSDWQAVVIYPSRTVEQEETRPYRAFLGSDQVHRIYLDELGEFSQLPLEVSLLALTTIKEGETPAAAKYLVNRAQQELEEDKAKRVIMELVTTILSYRFTQLSRVEIEAMLGITFEQTRLYHDLTTEAEARVRQEGKQEGEVSLILRLLAKKFVGQVPNQLKDQIETLSLEELAALTESILKF